MKKKILNCFVFFSFIILGEISCDQKGHGGVSNNIKESKKRNIFICEYEVNPNPYPVNDSLSIKILHAWVENQWAFGKLNDETITVKDKYQLVIEVQGNILQNYGISWTIGTDGNKYMRTCGSNCLITSFDQLPKNIENWEVQNGGELDSLSPKTIIGFFEIEKIR
jgi:hypothetical protein